MSVLKTQVLGLSDTGGWEQGPHSHCSPRGLPSGLGGAGGVRGRKGPSHVPHVAPRLRRARPLASRSVTWVLRPRGSG